MAFIPEIDTKKTKANAKRKLKEYPRWVRIACDSGTQKVTASYTFEPRQTKGDPTKAVERLAINKVDAELEIEAIEYAINNIQSPIHRRILIEKFLSPTKRYDFEIYSDLNISEAHFYNKLNEALLYFTELYRDRSLIVTI